MTGATAVAPAEDDTVTATATASSEEVNQVVSAIESGNTFATSRRRWRGSDGERRDIGSITNIENNTTIENAISVHANNLAIAEDDHVKWLVLSRRQVLVHFWLDRTKAKRLLGGIILSKSL